MSAEIQHTIDGDALAIFQVFARELDTKSPLRPTRDRFVLPEGKIYLDGNSLGVLPQGVADAVAHAVQHEWGNGLIGSWNEAGWWELPERVGARVAALVGAPAHTVTVADSTSVNLVKTAIAAVRRVWVRDGDRRRRTILIEPGAFGTDHYAMAAVAQLLDVEVREVEPNALAADLAVHGDEVALTCYGQVDFRTGVAYDVAGLTATAQDVGVLTLWDLCHSAGVLNVQLADWNVDFAVGCGYKYLNGGPGAPSFVYVAPEHLDQIANPLQGWWSHATPFAFDTQYAAASGIRRMTTGSAPILSMTALDAALNAFDGVDMKDVEATSRSVTGFFVQALDAFCPQLDVVTPREPDQRGSQISIRHEFAYAIVQALIARGVIGDFRAPDIIRLGFAPMYITHADALDAALAISEIIGTSEFEKFPNAPVTAVT